MAYRSVKIHIKKLSENEVRIIKVLAKASTEIYNKSLELVENHYKTVKILPSYMDILKILKDKQQLVGLGYGFEAVAKAPITNYKTYISRKVSYERSNTSPSSVHFSDNVKPPKRLSYSYLYSEKFRIVDDQIQFPIPYNLYRIYGPLRITLPKRYSELKIKKVSIQYDQNFTFIEMVLHYEVIDKTSLIQRGDYRGLGIDLGVSNMITAASSLGDSFIIDGKRMKGIIQGYEKYTALAKRNKCGKAKLAKIRKIKQNRIDDYLNKSVSYIMQYCQKYHIGNIIIGYNPNFKIGINLGKKNNQLFFQMPYNKFMEKLAHQSKKNGIKFTKTYEFYTSQASFLDGDTFPDYMTRSKQKFSGKRRYRGLYVASDGTKINADQNAAFNILSKCNAISSESLSSIRSRGIAQPQRVFPLKCAGCN